MASCLLLLLVSWLTGIEFEVEVLPVVHPDEGDAGQVGVEDAVDAAGEGVRTRLAEDVRHVRARRRLDAAAALPDLQKDTKANRTTLQLRATPYQLDTKMNRPVTVSSRSHDLKSIKLPKG